MDYRPWSHKESDRTEPLSTASLQVLLMKSGEEVVHTLRTGGLIIQGMFNLMEKVLLGQWFLTLDCMMKSSGEILKTRFPGKYLKLIKAWFLRGGVPSFILLKLKNKNKNSVCRVWAKVMGLSQYLHACSPSLDAALMNDLEVSEFFMWTCEFQCSRAINSTDAGATLPGFRPHFNFSWLQRCFVSKIITPTSQNGVEIKWIHIHVKELP